MSKDAENPTEDKRLNDSRAEEKRVDVRVSAGKCVRCGKPVNPRARPFCSQRCAELDLGSWLSERYRVPTGERPLEGEASDANPATGDRDDDAAG